MQVGEVAGIQVLETVQQGLVRSRHLAHAGPGPSLLATFRVPFVVGAAVAAVGLVAALFVRGVPRATGRAVARPGKVCDHDRRRARVRAALRWPADAGGVLVLHGFTGSPSSMRPLAERLAAAGYTVELPRLPGHGTAIDDLLDKTWDDWSGAALAAYDELAARAPRVAVVGLSMGGGLTAFVAERRPVAGCVFINPLVKPVDAVAAGDARRRAGPGHRGHRDRRRVGHQRPGVTSRPTRAGRSPRCAA